MDRFQRTIEFIKLLYGGKDFIPLHEPTFFGKEKEYLCETIDSTYVSSVGKFVDLFEDRMKALTGTSRAVAVVNGTAALQVALRMLGVNQETEVITQSLTFVATANAIAYNAAHPVFVDVDIDTMGMSPKALGDFLDEHAEKRDDGVFNKASGRKIAACLPMHTFGFLCRIEEIAKICKDWGIPLLEDAAEALGSGNLNGSAGSFGKMGVYSFNGNKTITSGGGGAIISNDKEIGDLAKYLTTTAKRPHHWEFFHDQLGYNFRMPNVNAALACAQLESLDKILKSKREVYQQYFDFFAEESIHFKEMPANTYSNHWLNAIQLESYEERNRFLEETNSAGIQTRPIWQLMHDLPMYSSAMCDNLDNSKFLVKRIVNLPSSARL